jgi:Flp pilus assembly protein TadG
MFVFSLRHKVGNYLTRQECDHNLPLFQKRKRGQALVEAAIIAPLIILFLLGMIDIGRMVYSKIMFTNAAREGAYYLSVSTDSSPTGLINTVHNEVQNSGVGFTDVVIVSPGTVCPDRLICVIPSCITCQLDTPVTVTVKATLKGFLIKTIISSNQVIMSAGQ